MLIDDLKSMLPLSESDARESLDSGRPSTPHIITQSTSTPPQKEAEDASL